MLLGALPCNFKKDNLAVIDKWVDMVSMWISVLPFLLVPLPLLSVEVKANPGAQVQAKAGHIILQAVWGRCITIIM